MVVLDIIILVLAVLFFIKGYSKGFLHTFCRFLGLILSLLLATHFSSHVAGFLFDDKLSSISMIWPALSYVITLFLSLLLVNFLLKLLISPINLSVLSPLNKLSGGLIYSISILFVAGTVIWFLKSMGIINESSLDHSYVSQYLLPLMPNFFELVGTLIPLFKESFENLNNFFKQLAQK